jgi:hypothetical protein
MRRIRKDDGGAAPLLPLLSRFRNTRAAPVATLAAAGLTTEHKDVRDTVVRAQRGALTKRSSARTRGGRSALPRRTKSLGASVSGITHIAEIDHREPYGDAGKFKVVFKVLPSHSIGPCATMTLLREGCRGRATLRRPRFFRPRASRILRVRHITFYNGTPLMYSWKNLHATIKRPTPYVVFSPCGGPRRGKNAFEPPCTGAGSPSLSRRPSIRLAEGCRSAWGA